MDDFHNSENRWIIKRLSVSQTINERHASNRTMNVIGASIHQVSSKDSQVEVSKNTLHLQVNQLEQTLV
jgi:hypothetical protein